MYKIEFEKWLNEKQMPSYLLEELKSMDEREKEEAFYKSISFGTGGLRGIIGPGINKMNIFTIRKATIGFAQYLISINETKGVAISYDNRFFSKEFAEEAARVLASFNIKPYLFEELRPTPMLSFAVREYGLSGGIMITASHNPKEYNGYKAYNKTGAQLNLEEADAVTKNMEEVIDVFNFGYENEHLITYIDDSFDDIYLKRVKDIQINKTNKNIKIVFSPLHGTGGTVVPKLLEELGYDVYPLSSQMIVDPSFENTKSSNPEEAIAYVESIKYAKEIDADIILVTDPDADRLGVAVFHQNEYHLLNGNQTASLKLYYKLKHSKEIDNGFVYTTNVTTSLINDIAISFNQNVVTTLTGFKFIGEKANELKNNETYVFGCEESYGSLISDFVRDKDAVQACLFLSEMASYQKDNNKTLIDLLEEVYEKYGYYYEWTNNITLTGIEGSKKISKIITHFREEGLTINNFNVKIVEDALKGYRYLDNKKIKLELPTSNVLKYLDESNNFIVFRPSGTEPKLKIYYSIKDKSLNLAKGKIKLLNDEITKIIDSL